VLVGLLDVDALELHRHADLARVGDQLRIQTSIFGQNSSSVARKPAGNYTRRQLVARRRRP